MSLNLNVSVFRFFENRCPTYMKDIYDPVDKNGISTRNSYLRLTQPRRKTNLGLNCLSYIGPSTWNKLPSEIKNTKTLNTFKHKIKLHYLSEGNRQEI